ncbi:MAG: hypothetical protein QME88_03430 [Actinomycetota bacterium]|nr:hypothetical protein [Actinomycetota bacterium]
MVVSESLPRDFWERQELLRRGKPAFVDMIGLTPDEVRCKIGRGLVLDALLRGEVPVGDAAELRELARAYARRHGLKRTEIGYVHG